MRRRAGAFVASLVLALPLAAGSAERSPSPAKAPRTVVTVIGFSDYHAHATPFTSGGRPDQGGIARAVAFLKEARRDPRTLVLSGGDTLNAGVPLWSDEYRCLDWPWLDGLVDAMALGNHDLDYGAEAFAACRAQVSYPVISASFVDERGDPVLTHQGKPYLVREVGGVRIGMFAVSGSDFVRLVKAANLPAGTRFADPVAAARAVVGELRTRERVDAVVLFGHEHRPDDFALARAVPGIDLILGTHSHDLSPLITIPGTRTRYISAYQYLAYVSRVRLAFSGHRLASVTGELVPLDASRPEDPEVARKVAELQRQLVARHPERFAVIGRTERDLSDTEVDRGETLVGNWATEALRRAAGAHAFVSTSSSFRAGLPLGEVTLEDFLSAFPYSNRLVKAVLDGAALRQLVELCASRAGTDSFCQQSGVRYTRHGTRVAGIQVLKDPAHPEAGLAPLDPQATYTVATTDFQAYVVGGYKELFAAARSLEKTELDAHAVLKAALDGATAELDGRDGGRPGGR